MLAAVVVFLIVVMFSFTFGDWVSSYIPELENVATWGAMLLFGASWGVFIYTRSHHSNTT